MVNDHFGALSEDKRQVARAALANVVGSAAIASATPFRGGATAALVFFGSRPGLRYLPRIEGSANPLRNPYQHVAPRMAAEAGIAPRVHYKDEDAA